MDGVAKEALATEQHDETLLTVTKRKRTKRHRLLLPLSAPSPTSTSAVSGCTTEEEEDMANCLILLAQGHTTIPTRPNQETELHIGNIKEKFTSRRFAEASTTTPGKAGFYVYECKTCNRCFPSFQALGGHRASHKKPKLAPPVNEDGLELSMNSLSKIRVVGKVRTHECSICGSEFSSGQALGGHMRRHRPAGAAEAPEARKERSVLSLDLNLPAPSEEERGGESLLGFPFMFSTSGMVDCHY